MNPLGPLRAGLSRYRRRKLSLDGRVPGVESPRFRGHIERPFRVSEAARGPGDATYNNDPLPVCYDPGIGPYRFDSSEYEQPDPWHDTAAFGAPPPPLSPVPNEDMPHQMEPPINHDLAGWMLRQFVNDAAEHAAQHGVDIHELFDPDRTARLKIGEIHESCARIDAYEASVEVGNLAQAMAGGFVDEIPGPIVQAQPFESEPATPQGPEPSPGAFDVADELAELPGQYNAADAFSSDGPEPMLNGYELGPEQCFAEPDDPVSANALPDPGMDPMAASPGQALSAPDALQDDPALEDIVDDEMQKMDPYGIMDPYHTMGPYGPMPDPRMMGMPMNPFGPTPPGL